MKKQIFYLFLWLAIPMQAQWTQQNSGTTENLNDVYCISADTVVVVGNNATILRTTNGGTDWLSISNPAAVNLHKVQFADTQIGYAVGDSGTLLKTTDAGVTWQALTTNTTENLLALSVVASDTLFVAGTNGLIMKSVDDGNNWSTLNSGVLQNIIDMQFVNNNVGYALLELDTHTHTNILLKTTDTGNFWSQINYLENIVIPTKMIYFESENNGYILFRDSYKKITVTGNTYNTLFESQSFNFAAECFLIENQKMWISGQTWDQTINLLKIDLNNQNNVNNIWASNTLYTNAFSYKDYKRYSVGNSGVIIINTTGINVVSIGKDLLSKFKILPNPANNIITINTNNLPISSYKIINVRGEILAKNTLVNQQINVSNLSNGIYLIQLNDTQHTYTQKLIIQK